MALATEQTKELLIAKWGDRFVAWLIDFIVVGAIAELIFTILALPFAFRLPTEFDFGAFVSIMTNVFHLRTAVFVAYWAYFKSSSGQSLGKKIMNLKVVDINGNVPNTTKSFLQALGKAFILPLDVLLGWVFLNEKRQRLLNKLSDTIVIKVRPSAEATNVKFVKV